MNKYPPHNPEIIISTPRINMAQQTRQQQQEKQELQQHGKSLIDDQITQMEQELEPYIHENTKYYLNTVIQEITPYLSSNQILELVKTLCNTFNCVECIKKERKGNYKNRNQFLLTEFHNTKLAECCSKKTLRYYDSTLKMFLQYVDKHLDDVTTEDVQKYLMYGITERGWSPTTQDNTRRILNTFYVWAVSRKYVLFNPISPIKPTKNKKYRVKKPIICDGSRKG